MNWLVKRFVKDYEDVKDTNVRANYGRVASLLGIVLNIFLFGTKFMAGVLVGSVSVQADAINNLSDAATSIISLISFKLSSRPADKEHPYGHARYESIASMLVAAFIFILGFELARNSFDKIFDPVVVEMNWILTAALVVSVLVKLYMYRYNKKFGKLLDSSVMNATAADSLSDCIATTAVLVSLFVGNLTGLAVDGYVGIVVAIFIFKTGIDIIKDALDEILGKVPSTEMVDELLSYIKGYDGVLGVHDTMVHDYGPNKLYATAHVEVDANVDILISHDMIDMIEREVKEKMGINLVLHMDPIITDDPRLLDLLKIVKDTIKGIDERLSFHDFRVVFGKTHNNIIFDVLIPFDCDVKPEDIKSELKKNIKEKAGPLPHYLVINFDRPYV